MPQQVQIQHSRMPNGMHCAYVELVGPGGKKVRIQACASEQAVQMARQVLAQRGIRFGVGGFLDDIASVAKKIARGRLIQKLASAYKSVANNPLIARTVGMIPIAGQIKSALDTAASAVPAHHRRRARPSAGRPPAETPHPTINFPARSPATLRQTGAIPPAVIRSLPTPMRAREAARAAIALAARVAGGDAAARAQVARTAQLAASGNQAARNAAQILSIVNRRVGPQLRAGVGWDGFTEVSGYERGMRAIGA